MPYTNSQQQLSFRIFSRHGFLDARSTLFTAFAPMDSAVSADMQSYDKCSNGSFGNRCEFEFAISDAHESVDKSREL